MGYTATVLGASGFSGGELIRFLAGHPEIDVVGVAGGRRAGAALGEVHPHLRSVDLVLLDADEAAAIGADVCFSALPAEAWDELETPSAGVVVDLSDRHRGASAWTYGLPELDRGALPGSRRIANPGCYPTAALLALVPFARAGLVAGPVVIDALSGASGAGRSAEDRLLFAVVDGGATAYGSTAHRHVAEIERGLGRLGGLRTPVSFTPHLIPTTRGLLVTARARAAEGLDDDAAVAVLRAAYRSEPFVEVVDGWPATKAVAGSNRAMVAARVDERAGWLICSAAIDNLGKGAAGQAVQNANLALGLDETAGLEARAVWP